MRKISVQRVTVIWTGVVLLVVALVWRGESKSRPTGVGRDPAAASPPVSPPPPVVARPSSPPQSGSAPTPVVTPAQVAAFNEAILMARLRGVAASDSAQAVEIAREGNRRFPDSADAPERTAILIHALANLDRTREARGEAERMVNHYADSSWVREIEGFSGAHRHRNIHVADGGLVESD